MIEFDPTPEQCEMQMLARRFAEKEIRPVSAEYDEREEVPWEVIHKAARAGFLSYFIQEEYGGGGITDMLTHCLVDEEIFWGCAGIGSILGGTSLCATPIMLAGSEDQKEKYLSIFCDPNRARLGAFALTEPAAGSDPVHLVTQVQRDGNDYILNGDKTFITNAGIADVYVVFATLDVNLGHRGITAFIVEKDTPGLVCGKKEKKMGIRASQTATLSFQDMHIPKENRLGEEGEGFSIAMHTFEYTRTHTAIAAVGLARAAMEYALGYAQERVQFGKPIINHQAIAFMLAEMAMQVDAARLLTWRSACLADKGVPCTKEASMAKAFAADVAMQVTTDAVQILGGYGYMRDYPVEKWMRDAKIMQIYEGTAQIQRLIIARYLTQNK